MQSRRLFVFSLILNVIFIPTGAVYLIRKAEFLVRQQPLPQNEQPATRTNSGAGFVSTFDYQWPKQLFESEPVQPGAIVFLGDSLIAAGHWSEVWQGKTRRPILNRGLSGDTMDGVLQRLDEVIRHQPSKLFVMVGINDLRFDQKTPAVLVGQYRSLVREVTHQSPGTEIYLLGLMPVSSLGQGEINRQVSIVNRQLSAMSEMSDSGRVHYVDISSLMADEHGELRKELTFDGVHIRAIGYQKWRDAIWPLVER